MKSKPHLLRWIERTLWLAGIVLLGWVGLVWADGQLYQSRAEDRLEEALAVASRAHARAGESTEGLPEELPGEAEALRPEVSEPEAAPAPAEPAFPEDLVGRLAIPRLDLSVMVSHGTDARVLRRGAGHISATALPGSSGNVGIAGHRDRHFRPLKDVAPGDELLLTTVEGTFRYRVNWTRVVEPHDVHVLDPTEEPALTLVTCYPFYFVGNAPQRFIVRAHQVGWRPLA